ncbi:Ribonuclease H-like superfamily protein [Rhynchospora pubera]|uniref:Ribonuclease H-like superfamily protein n=1 Tax=Rhynchospora pubera TaxID=906938 RepID=A0AAV8H2W4_9POAL|nr:Ribonuclease H-like superfamily protein [Rhynchospora pubera]
MLTHNPDRLVFTAAKNGQFSIKAAYLLLLRKSNPSQNTLPKEICNMIWHTRGILPRTRVFLWRATHEALPVDALFSTRLEKQKSGCNLCNVDSETVAHVLFKCPRAQQVWLASDFGLRTCSLPDSVQQIIVYLINHLEGQQISKLGTIMWHIWKDRCKVFFQGKKTTPQQTLAAAHNTLLSLQAADSFFSITNRVEVGPPVLSRHSCWIDASWVHANSQGTGMAFILWDKDELVQYRLATGTASSPFHAELLGFKRAIQVLLQLDVSDCVINTDCLELKQVLNDEMNISEVEWKAFHDALQVKMLWDREKLNRNWFCAHKSRDLNILADQMAKFARIRDIDCIGFTFPAFINM